MIIPRKSLFMGLDASRSRNATGLVGIVRDGRYFDIVYADLWEPKRGKPVNLSLVCSKVERAHELGLLGAVAVDPFGLFSKLSEWEAIGLPFVEIGQTATRYKTDSLLLELIQQGRIRHNGNKDLRRHIGQAQLVETVRGVRIGKQRGVDNDLAISLALAVWICQEEDFVPAKITAYRGNPLFGGLEGVVTPEGYQELDSGVVYDPARGLEISTPQKFYEATVKQTDHKFSTCPYRSRGCKKCIAFLERARYHSMSAEEHEDFKNRALAGEYDNG